MSKVGGKKLIDPIYFN